MTLLPYLRSAILIVTFSISSLRGQSLRDAPFFSLENTKLRQEASERANASVQTAFSIPTHFDKEAKKAFTDERMRIGQHISANIKEDAIFDDVLYPFLKGVLSKIVAANPELTGTTVILTAEPVPNAFSVGDGTLVVFTGLISELENEDQLAFVLCHEIAHFALQHANKQLVKEIERYQSKEFKAQIKKVQEAEFNQSELIESMFRNMQFKSRYHRRDLERQADSLAYTYFLHTDYDPSQAMRLMEVFDDIDKPDRDSSLQLEGHFGCAQYPFQQKWKDKGKESIWGSAIEAQEASKKAYADSISTHPDSKLRLQWLTEMAGTLQPPKHTPSAKDYQPYRFLSALENVEAWYTHERYDRTIYTALIYQGIYPECTYFKDVITLSINGLFTYTKNHNVSAVLSQTSPYYDTGYNELLALLNNLRLSDLTALQACSLETQSQPEKEYGLYATYCFAVCKEDTEQAKKLKKQYLKLYPKGRFIGTMEGKK